MSKLSAIVVFQNREADVESILTALYEHHDLPLELIIINDGSTDETGNIIQSVVEYFRHEETYYFENPAPIGRGRALNEALVNITGDIVWTPDSAAELDFEKLTSLLEHLSKFPYAGASMFTPDVESLGIAGDVGIIPADQAFFWNWNMLPSQDRYFNPGMERGYGYELWLRLGRPRLWKTPPHLFRGDVKWNFLDLERPERNELRFALLRGGADNRDQARIIEQQIEFIPRTINVLDANSKEHEEYAEHAQLIDRAKQALKEGNYSVSLDAVERVLREDPLHKRALILKIQLLERMRRYVEAAELKFTLKAAGGQFPEEKHRKVEDTGEEQQVTDEKSGDRNDEEPVGATGGNDPAADTESNDQLTDNSEPVERQTVVEEPEDKEIGISVIIPVTGSPKLRLERCLHSLYRHESPSGIELILIDNATLDDTPDYLNQLQKDGFFHCKVISNPQNLGFSMGINQGIEQSRGNYVCVMHDDVELVMPVLNQLKDLLITNETYSAVAPSTDYTLNIDQSSEKAVTGKPDRLIEIEYLDSYCLMFQNQNYRFDEAFPAAYFEDIDFSFQLRENGGKVGVTPGLWVHHEFGSTTAELGIPVRSPRYWENAEYFHKKWNMEITFPKDHEKATDIDKLLILNELINPYFPEPHLLQLFDDLFTSELRTQILENEWAKDVLVGLVQLMMKMEVRDVLRALEDELSDVELNEEMLFELAYFYFRHNIFSRSRHYINEYPGEELPFRFRLLELEMFVAEKEVETAVELLTNLLEVNPSHPDLYRISGELHQLNGNDNEASRFFDLARQIDPYRYSEKNNAVS